jgi:hypothetical protein
MEDSSFGRLVGVLFSPKKTFASISERPTWLLALVTLIVIAGGLGLMLLTKVDMAEFLEAQMAAQGTELPEDQLENILRIQEIAAGVGGFIGAAVAYLVMALVFWGVFKLVGGDFDFKRSLSVVVHASVPTIIKSILTFIVVLGTESLDMVQMQSGTVLASNLAALAPEDTGRPLLTLLAFFDVFGIWTLALLVIGFAAIARVKVGKSAGVVIGAWAFMALISFGLAFLSP